MAVKPETGEVRMDRCPKCKKRMKPVLGHDGRTDFKCLACDEADPFETAAAKWADRPLDEEAA
jgi:tRNA(Ile2) C34 agmatinyltransferase TiaS